MSNADPFYQARPLMDLIGDKEANGDYNKAYLGKKAPFTDMTLNDVIKWQGDYLKWQKKNRKGKTPSSAVGKYQIIRPTLKGLMKNMKLKGDEKFTPELQDQMIVELMKEKGYDKWVRGDMPDEDFANNLAKTWASFPVVKDMQGSKRKVKRGESYHAGVGNNKALISPEEVLGALKQNKPVDEEITIQELMATPGYLNSFF